MVLMSQKKTIGIWATGGGPTGGRAILGMVKFLEEIGMWPNRIKVIGGTSIGAYVLTVASTGKSSEKLIEMSFKSTPEVSATPNLKTKIGFFDIEVSLELIKNVVFNGKNPMLKETPIPMVMAATNWSTLEPLYLDGNTTFIDGLRAAIANPIYFGLEQTKKGVIGDSGITTSVGVEYLREKYKTTHTILLDVQSEHKWQPKESLSQSFPRFAKLPIELALLITKIPGLGIFFKKHSVASVISALEHLPYEIDVLSRASVALLTRIIDLEIEKQKPNVVIKLEDAVLIQALGSSAYDREIGMQQIMYGYQAAKVQEEKLKTLLT